jgi:dolichyl-phosphate beta-glucosyltransferase
MSPSLTLILPAYNEVERLGPALDELFAWLDGPGAALGEVLVLVVDDGSTDGTAALVRARPETRRDRNSPARLQVLTVPHKGKGAAVRAGMLAGEGDILIFTDADMATPPDQIPRLLDALQRADVALGSRIQQDGTDRRTSQPLLRRVLGKAFHLFASIWVVGPVEDTQCGFKGFTRSVARDLFSMQHVTSIVFDVELIYLARRRGYRIEVVPVEWADRRGSRMRARPGLALRVAFDLLRIPFQHRRVARVRPAGS